ncbi:hypothetical protein EK21DRAFT_59289 [Setomelanomma holmii]|uniref:Uncharacterized protein n=1 Tax=Setomelanomma holmii TaxID=210430 RepID=A0A9P4HHL7_9PLEO|nr:hypothetical protein EK21DRAFT_59289 [Setomelanomma holmii]
MANSNGLLPIYSASTPSPMYSRAMSGQHFPHLETRSMYPATWSVPYTDDTSPIETYGLDQPANYLPKPAPMSSSSMYNAGCRLTYPTARSATQGGNGFYDPDLTGLPYLNTNNLRSTVHGEPTSPLNMTSFYQALPERPHTRQPLSESSAPQRQLPFPQPSGGQSSRNAVDQLQDQRLRSAQAMSGPSTVAGTMFAKPLFSWSTDSDSQANPTAVPAPDVPPQLPTTADGTLNFLSATTSMVGDGNSASAPSQLQINFSTPALLENMNALAPASTYSNFRESRAQGSGPKNLTRHDSQTNLYSFNSDSNSKRNSFSSGTLVNGTPYQPLPQQQPQASSVETSQCQSLENRPSSLHRSSMGNMSSSF